MSSETAIQLRFPFGSSGTSQAREEPKVGEMLQRGNDEWPVIAAQTDANGNTIVTIGPKIGSRNGKTHVTARSSEDRGLLLDEIRLDFRRSIDVRPRVIEARVVTHDVQAENSRARAAGICEQALAGVVSKRRTSRDRWGRATARKH
jgi:hypothetical protein